MVWDTQQSEVLILPRTLNVSPTLYEFLLAKECLLKNYI